jgi:hypothetical protein
MTAKGLTRKEAERLVYLSVEIENAVSGFKTKIPLYEMIKETRALLKKMPIIKEE